MIAAVIPNTSMVATAVPTAVIPMISIMAMIMIAVVIAVVPVEPARAPLVVPHKTVAYVEIVAERWAETVDAGIVGPAIAPLVAPPVAVDPVIVRATRIAIVER